MIVTELIAVEGIETNLPASSVMAADEEELTMEQLGQEDPQSFKRLIWAMVLMAVVFGATSYFLRSKNPPPPPKAVAKAPAKKASAKATAKAGARKVTATKKSAVAAKSTAAAKKKAAKKTATRTTRR